MGCTPSRVGPNPARQAGLTEAAREAADLTEPLAATHFHDRARLAALVLGPAGDATTADADIRLLSARKLVKYIDGGGKMLSRQELEAAGTDLYLDAATVHGLVPELETTEDGRCTFSGVVALSYARESLQDPDPQRTQLQSLRPVLVWWMSERARRKLGYTGMYPDAAIKTADFGVFVDFMSIFQPDDATSDTPAYTKPAEQASFGRALHNMGLVHGHYGTTCLLYTSPSPRDRTRSRMPSSA